ncbi:MAG: B12-binding domain-containing radical SAM protein [Nitrospirae bacterium]|nr:B12-binding domain-containing radical SAM protein [Nitrospirota bacterium]
MTLKKISFIESGGQGFQMLSRFTIARVGTVLLPTLLKERGYEVKAFIEDISPPDWSFIEDSDLVCISTLTATALRAYTTAERVRTRGIPVVMGGAHPTFLPEEALEHSDFVVRGEGDLTLPELLEHIEKGRSSLRDIAGLSYREKDGRIVHTPPRRNLEERELDELPTPDFSLVHKWKPSYIHSISTSRGCPFDCKFCSVIHMFGRKYRFKSVEASLRDLRQVDAVSKSTRFFVDDNFTAHKGRAKELLRGMIAEKLTSSWAAQVRTDVATDPELLRLMADAGCHTLYIGFESINPRTLVEFNKKQEPDDIVNCVRTVKDFGIHIHGMFVLGADTDDVETIRKTADFAIRCGIDTTQMVALTPLPGTPFFNEMKEKGRILHTDWSRYNVQHVVFRPAQMTPETLQFETMKGMKKFYSWKYILKHLASFDLHYAAVGVFGRRAVNKVVREASAYLGKESFDCASF